MAPWCIYISCIERVARCGSGRDNVRGVVGTMNAARSRPDWLATVQSGRKQVQSRVCTPGFSKPEPEDHTTGTIVQSPVDRLVTDSTREGSAISSRLPGERERSTRCRSEPNKPSPFQTHLTERQGMGVRTTGHQGHSGPQLETGSWTPGGPPIPLPA